MEPYKIFPRLYAALYLRKKSPSERVSFGRTIHSQISSNSLLFPSPTPSLSDLQLVIDNLAAKMTAASRGNNVDESRLAEAIYLFDTVIIDVAAYAERIANANPLTADATLRAAGFTPTKRKEKTPVPEPVSKLVAVFTNQPSVLLKWKGVPYARYYTAYMTTTPNDSESWMIAESTSRRKLLVPNLQSCQRYFFRIISCGIHGLSAPSAVVSCVAG